MGTQITGGVDTHLDVHVAAALDEHGGLLGTASFATTPAGYRELVEWFASLGDGRVGRCRRNRQLRRRA